MNTLINTQSASSITDRLAGGLVGLLIGDALGVPYEFHSAAEIPQEDLIEFDPPPGFRRAHDGIAPGTWSDEGAQALCLLASLLHCGRFDPQNLGNRLVNWHDHGYLAVDGLVFDVGGQTAKAIGRIRAGVPALEAGGTAAHGQGNGSLMRVLPLVLWHQGTDAELVRDAHNQSCVTHGHVTVQVCCALYCLWARAILRDTPDPWEAALAALRAIYVDYPEHAATLETDLRPDSPRPATGTGYVVDCLFSAKAVLQVSTYEGVVKASIALGNDTDTTACVAGGLAGIRDGINAIPLRWRDALRGQAELAPLLQELLTARSDLIETEL